MCVHRVGGIEVLMGKDLHLIRLFDYEFDHDPTTDCEKLSECSTIITDCALHYTEAPLIRAIISRLRFLTLMPASTISSQVRLFDNSLSGPWLQRYECRNRVKLVSAIALRTYRFIPHALFNYLVAVLALLQFLFLCIHSRSLALDVQTQVLHKLNIIHVELLAHVALECHVRFELGLEYLEVEERKTYLKRIRATFPVGQPEQVDNRILLSPSIIDLWPALF